MALYAFDGTLNRRDAKAAALSVRRDTTETNVHRFREFFGPGRTEYLQGVGTRFKAIGVLFGGAFGIGAHFRLRRMYLALAKRYYEGDKDIDVIGFSRGAALAIHFTNVIARYGVPPQDAQRHWLFKHYDGLGWTFHFPKLTVQSNCDVTIRFLGLWDTVATFGLPIRPFRNRLRKWLVRTIPRNVLSSFHAMALDEVRTTYELVRPVHEQPKRHYELWFRGVHSNIGGSYPDRGLSDIALAWMMEMYLWTLDIEKQSRDHLSPNFAYALQMTGPDRSPAPSSWDNSNLETLEPDPDGELGLPAALRRTAWRPLPEAAAIHHSAFLRTKNLLLDHYRANRRLLRRIPPDTVPMYDPPFFYQETPRRAIERVANEAFGNIPVRAAPWLKIGDAYPVRSDEWMALSPSLESVREDLIQNYSLATFRRVAVAWLEAGKPAPEKLCLDGDLCDFDGNKVEVRACASCIVEVLKQLEYYVPNLRNFRPPQGDPPRGPR